MDVMADSTMIATVRYDRSKNGVKRQLRYSHDAVISLPTSSTDPMITTGQKAPGNMVANPITE